MALLITSAQLSLHTFVTAKLNSITAWHLKVLHCLASYQTSLYGQGSYIIISIHRKWHFSTTLTPYICNNNTRRSWTDKWFLAVPQLQPSLHKSKNNSIIVWHLMVLHCGMPCLTTFVLLLILLHSGKGSNHTFWHGLPSLISSSPWCLHWCWPLLCPWTYEIAKCLCLMQLQK